MQNLELKAQDDTHLKGRISYLSDGGFLGLETQVLFHRHPRGLGPWCSTLSLKLGQGFPVSPCLSCRENSDLPALVSLGLQGVLFTKSFEIFALKALKPAFSAQPLE